MTSRLLTRQGQIYISLNSFLLLVPEIFCFALIFKVVSYFGSWDFHFLLASLFLKINAQVKKVQWATKYLFRNF